MQIDVSYDSSVASAPSAFETDVNIAVQYLEGLFTNPITITIDVGYGEIDGQSLESGVLGESDANYVTESYTAVRSALIAENAPGSSTLPATSPFSGSVDISTAEAEALGLYSSSGIDGYVGFSSTYPFSYGDGTTPSSNEYYFIGLVEHEITEDMGRVSLLNEQPGDYSVMDLYRWSSPGVRDMTTGGNGSTAYFSIDDGNTNLGTWNNQTSNGDLGDWYPSGPAPGGNDAFNDYSSPGVINAVSTSDIELMEALGYTGPSINPSPPGGTTAAMVMNAPSDGDYEIYDIGGNTVLAAYPLIQVQSPWTFAALGSFQSGDTGDMLLRNTSTGQFEAYYVSSNSVTGTANVGTVGTNWNFAGVGDFDGQSSLSELLLHNLGSGAFELYQVAGGGVLSGSSVGAVGSNFTVEGFGHFSESSTTQMLMQGISGASSGQLELYTYNSSAAFAGTDVGDVGSNLTFLGCADLLGNGTTQMVMQQNNGDLWLYTYNASANALSGTEVGAVGSNFQAVGFGPLGTSGQDEMLMQNAAGDFEVYQYNASENAFVGSAMGAVGSPWVVDGIVGTDPPASGASVASASTAQLVQAIASISNGSDVSSASYSTADLETVTPTLLTTPQHA